MMQKLILFLVLTGLLGLLSCEKTIDSNDLPTYDNAYFPIQITKSITYQITEINIDKAISVNDTISYQIKEKIESKIEDTDDYVSYRLERYFRSNSEEEWSILNVWQIRQYARRIHKIEDNIEYMKLITPVRLNEKWDGNAFNTLDEETCKIETISSVLIGNTSSSIASVIHQDQSSLIDKNFSEEQYAEKIGLYKKTLIDVELSIDPSLPWNEKITKGSIYYQNFIETSYE